jgi:L-ascorbate metabolism protein UlaG (beta-lactamase superfamily)
MNLKGKLIYLGHASLRLESGDGLVIYVDPYAGKGYDLPADLILSTHGHADHCGIHLVTQKEGCIVITHREALQNEVYQNFTIDSVKVQAVPAYNRKHSRDNGVGYMITMDGTKIYIPGDTSKIPEMADFAKENITYAFFPIDGVYNMGPEEASECAAIIGAKYDIPIHTCPSTQGIFKEENALLFKSDHG